MKKAHFVVIASISLALALGMGVFCWRGINNISGDKAQQPVAQMSVPEEALQNLVWYQIPELGVEFQLDKVVADELLYKYEPTTGVYFGALSFFTKKFLQIPGCESGKLAALTRLEGIPNDYDENVYLKTREWKQFDGFFIVLGGAQTTCALSGHEVELDNFFKENPRLIEWLSRMFETMRILTQPVVLQPSLEELERTQSLVWYQIPELGVEFQVRKEVADELVVHISQLRSDAKFGSVLFSSKKLLKIPRCEASSGPLGALVKVKGIPSDYENADYFMARNPKQFDDFFVLWNGPQAVCASEEYRDEFDDFFKNSHEFNGWSTIVLDTIREIN